MTTGIAFIMEGATEKEFYVTLLNYLCTKHHAKLERILIPLQSEVIYRLEKAENEEYIIKFNVVNSVTQLPRAGNWFRSQCIDKYNQMDWHVFLCYDKDEYKEDISKFYEGDWTSLRKKLKKAKTVVDIAASADIEDIMLQDLSSICRYLGCDVPSSLNGRKGKVKMKNLFRDNGQAYHEGNRARNIIENLDMELLMNANIAPLREIERRIWE